MRRTPLFCLTFTLFTALSVHAQPDSLWSRTYGGRVYDVCNSLIQTADGGFALAGVTNSFGGVYGDFWLVRADENGDSLWAHNYGGRDYEECNSLIQTADGGFALAGITESFGAGGNDIWLVRTDENGDSLWSHHYGGEHWDECRSLVQTADGGFALGGVTTSFGAMVGNFWLVRTDENGDSLWSRSYGGERGNEDCFSLVQTADGGFALAGYSWLSNLRDIWLVRTNGNGDSLWTRTYGGSGHEGCTSLIQTEDGGFMLAGYTSSFGAGDYDFWLMETGESGDSLWSRTYGGELADISYSLAQTADGGFALAGVTNSSGVGGGDFWIVLTDENGDSLWSRTFGGLSGDGCSSLIQTMDGGFALAGSTSSFGAGSSDFWLVKLGPENSVPGDEATAPVQFGLDAVYPNPFNSQAVVSCRLSVDGWVELGLYDLSGRLVQTLAEGWQEAGEHQAVIDGTQLPSGVYLVRLTGGRESAVIKAALLK